MIHKIEIIDRQKENEIFADKLTFFFKFAFLPLITGILLYFLGILNGFVIVIACGVSIVINAFFLKKKHRLILNVTLAAIIIVLLLSILGRFPLKDNGIDYESLCKEECASDKIKNAPSTDLPENRGYLGYDIIDESHVECKCGQATTSIISI